MKLYLLPFLAFVSAQPVYSSSSSEQTENSTCTLFLKTTLFKDGHEEEQVECFDEMTNTFSKVTSVQGSELIQKKLLERFKTGELISAESTMMNKKAHFENSSYVLPSDDVADAAFGHKPNARNRRRLGISGDRTVLAVRLDYANSVGTTASMTQISEGWFDTSSTFTSFKSQTEACSYGEVTVSKFTGANIVNGVINVDNTATVFDQTASIYEIGDAARIVVENALSALPDHLALCLPPSTSEAYNEIAGYAYVNSHFSAYNDEFCLHTATQMHEVGHNWALAHSTYNGEEYGDNTDVMGLGDGPKMCYNAPKNVQLGWYADKTVTLTDSWSGRLYGLSSYNSVASGDAVILYIPSANTRSRFDYYVSFNGRSGINNDVQFGVNEVLVHYRTSGTGGAFSYLESLLEAGNSFTSSTSGVSVSVNSISGSSYADVAVTVEPCEDMELNIIVRTDSYPEDTAWSLTNNCNGEVVQSFEKEYQEDDTKYTQTLCVPSGEYTFTITDSYNDGISENGFYRVRYDGGIVASGADFGSSESTTFGECSSAPVTSAPVPAPVTSAPVPAPVTSAPVTFEDDTCSDFPGKIKFTNKVTVTCAEMTPYRCSKPRGKSFCPVACGTTGTWCNKDAKGRFEYGVNADGETVFKGCPFVKRVPEKIATRCSKGNVDIACRATCQNN